jgi:hypothetical protein
MAKRSRLAARPGQRRPLQRTSTTRPATSTPPPPPPTSVTPEEEARAAELEAAILAEEQVAEEARTGRQRGRPAAAAPVTNVASSSVPLSVREAAEYRYVQRDVRRIILVGGFLLLILAVLEVLVNGLHLFTL